MLYQIKAYIKFLVHSTNQHGVHSPFVYDLVTKCFYDKTRHPEYQTLKEYRNGLMKNHDIITITDFGAGSRVFNGNERKVASIAKVAGITQRRQRFLFRLVRYLNPTQILELGTSLGMGSAALSLGNPEASVTTVEGCQETGAQAQRMFNEYALQNIILVQSPFEDFFAQGHNKKYDLVYIDGNHSKEHTLTYFHKLLDTVHNDSVWIFDDIHWSPGMNEAWMEIIHHPKVTVSIDTFYWGLVFFRKEQPKQHFKIRM